MWHRGGGATLASGAVGGSSLSDPGSAAVRWSSLSDPGSAAVRWSSLSDQVSAGSAAAACASDAIVVPARCPGG